MLSVTFLFVTFQVLGLNSVSQSYEACYPFDPPEHSKIRFFWTYYVFSCDHGYTLLGHPYVQCINNEWERSPPSCVVESDAPACKTLPIPMHGAMKCDQGPPTIGKACEFGCAEGYELRGVKVRRCMADGQWSGPETICIPISGPHCKLPPPLEHGTVIGCTSTYLPRVSERCSFRCNEGYILKGPKSLTCTSAGKLKDNNGRENFPECVIASPETDVCFNHSCQQLCRNENGRAQCRCNKGYKLNQEDQRTCNRIYGKPTNPQPSSNCQVRNGGCDHTCTPTSNGVLCSCREGYARSGLDLKKCIRKGENSMYPENPCFLNNGGCDHYCSLTRDRKVFCSCMPGYERGGNDLKKCIKDPVSEPLVTPASVTCQVNNGGCEHHCATDESGVYCGCKEGYRLHADGKHCVDIDECSSQSLNNCQERCINTRGSYTCSCRQGFVLRDGYRCEDIDECSIQSSNNCQQDCINTRGSYACRCKQGFVLRDGYRCEDIDECAMEVLNNCQHHCRNTEGSYICSCKPGFVLMDGYKCEGCGKGSYWSFRLNGCDQCPENSHTLFEGKTSIEDCICDPGFVGNPGDGIKCKDINECLDNNFGCSDTCFNTPGDAYCTCPIGFKLDNDNKTCVDIDECSVKNGGCEGICHNLHGSFRCSCPEGFVKSNRDHYSCNDLDECQENNGGCGQVCINYRGGYYCACQNGYRLDSGLKNCTDIECPALPVPLHSYVGCKKEGEKLEVMQSYPRGTICLFKCNTGYKRDTGSQNMRCLENGTWEGTLPTCRAQNCDSLSVPENGVVHPSFCATQGAEVKQRCAFTCHPGYKLEGYPVLTCRNNLTWNHEVPVCQPEKVHPRIQCPRDVTATLNPRKNTHNITLQEPITNVENYEVYPDWVFLGIWTEFPAGVTEVTFTATSPSSNKVAKCVTTVTVLDEEPPVFEYCPEPINIEGAGAEGEFVTWEEPVVTDNVEVESVITISEPNTTFAPGTYVVEYIARDTAGNTASCSFDISITRVNCSDLADPRYGKANCMDWMLGKICQPYCKAGFMRNSDDPVYYSCDDSGAWEPSDRISECLKFIPATSTSCPDGYVLQTDNETNEEVCVECPSNTVWSARTKKCEE